MNFIVFDLDDTLLPSSAGYDLAYRSIEIDPDSEHFHQARRNVKSRLPLGHTSARNRWLYLKEYLELQNKFTPQKLILMMTRYEEVLCGFLKLEWDRLEREKLFDALKMKAHLCIMTNENTRQQILKINSIDPLGKFFSTILTSEELGYEKPELKCFQEVEKKLGGQSASRLTYVGNEIETDLRPAESLGWKTFLNTEFALNSEVDKVNKFYHRLDKLDDILEFI